MNRNRLTALALASLIALTALVAGCGGGGEEPASPSALLVDSARAVREQKPARFAFDTQAKVDEIVPAAGADAQVQQFAASPSSVGLDGAYSPEAISLKGSAGFGGQTFTAEALAGAKEAYVRFLGQWYGTKQFGLDTLRQAAQAQSGRSTDQAFNEAVSNIERYGKDAFEGEVSEGPELDGTATWQTEGTLNVDGLAKIAQDQGQTVNADDRATLEKVAQGTTFTYVVGQDDKLPRQLKIAVDLKPSDLAATASDGGEELQQVDQVRASFTVNMSKWGDEVTIEPPPNFQPLEQLIQNFGGAGAAGGGIAP